MLADHTHKPGELQGEKWGIGDRPPIPEAAATCGKFSQFGAPN
jgi:hypothetical protein